MDNRSTKLTLPKSKNQVSGIWGLADMFDFRNGRTNQKLLTNGKTMNKHNSDSENLGKVDMQTNFCEKCRDTEDACKIKVKDIMQEEFPTEKQLKKLLKAVKEQQTRKDFECIHQSANNPKKAMKTSHKAFQMQIDHRKEKMHLEPHQHSRGDELSSDSFNFTTMLEEICSHFHQNGGCNGDVRKSITPRFKQLDEINLQLLQMSAKAFIDQIYINRRYASRASTIDKSTSFSDASEILHLNRDLFLKLLQDPNSLVVKHIQKLQFPKREKDKRKLLCNSKSSECQSSAISKYRDPECTMRVQKKNMNNHLWKKLKDRYGFSFKGSTCSGANEIVVLQPVSKSRKHPQNVSSHCSGLPSHQSYNDKGQNIKSTYFSFKEIKRKFKQAVGESRKEQHLIVDSNRISHKRHSLKYAEIGISRCTSARESTLSNDFQWMEKQQKLFSLVSRNGSETESNNDIVGKKLKSLTKSGSMKDQFDIFTEAKRHLSERLKSVNVGEILPQKQSLRTLEMILSSPECPKRDMSASVSEPMRFSVYSNMEKVKGVSCQSFQKQNEEVQPSVDFRCDDQLIPSETKPNLLENNYAATEMQENVDASGEDLKHRGHVRIPEENKSMLADTLNNLEVPYEKSMAESTYTEQSIETSISSDDNGNEECSSLADFLDDHHQISSADPSSTPLDISALQILDICKAREGHPSPVSVLQPFSSEDINSPTSTVQEPAGSPLQPRHIDFDDQLHVESADPRIDVATCQDGEDYISAYVRAVMQASELSFEELSASSPSLQHAIDSYLFNNVGLFQVGTNSELNLLLDCIHEVLVGVYYSYFSCSPYLSFLKPITRSVPLEANVVDEVVKEVNYHLFPEMGQRTSDQLVSKDITKSSSWSELHPDTEAIVIQIAEDVLQDSMMDTILRFQI